MMSQTPETVAPAPTNSNDSTSQAAKRKAAAKPKAPSQPKTTGGRQSKQDRVLGMLRRMEGATVAAVVKATGWQPHSVRGFFAGVVRKKLTLNLISQETNGKRTYRIATGKPADPVRSKRKRAN